MSRKNPFHTREHFFTYDQAVAMNLRFARAMFAARRIGNVNFSAGVEVNATPLIAARIPRDPDWSLMSSPAGALADTAPEEHRWHEWTR